MAEDRDQLVLKAQGEWTLQTVPQIEEALRHLPSAKKLIWDLSGITDFDSSGVLSFRRRIRYFTDGLILGSKEYCEQKYKEFRPYFKTKKKERKGHLIKLKNQSSEEGKLSGDLLNIYSIKKLSG